MFLIMHKQSDCHAATPLEIASDLKHARRIMKKCETFYGQGVVLHKLSRVDTEVASYHWDGYRWQTLVMQARKWEEYQQRLSNVGNDTEARAAEVRASNLRYQHRQLREARAAIYKQQRENER